MTWRNMTRLSRFEKSFVEWVVQHRLGIIAASILVAAAAASGLRFLDVDDDLRVFFSDDNPELRALEELEAAYTKADSVLFLIAPKDGTVFTPATLAVVQALTEVAWQTPHSNRVDSITNFQNTTAEGGDFTVGDLVPDARTLTAAGTKMIRRVALAEPLLVDRLISRAGDVTAITILLALVMDFLLLPVLLLKATSRANRLVGTARA